MNGSGMIRKRSTALALMLSALAFPAGAEPFNAPAGCTGVLTVQSRGCRVSNHYICERDAAGEQWRVDFDQEGVTFLSKIDHEAQWIESYELFPTVKQTLDAEPADPASFSELLATGADSFDFRLTKDTGERRHMTGFDRLTGKNVTIDGVALQQTEFSMTEYDTAGNVTNRARGNEFIHAELRLFFSGLHEWNRGEGYVPSDGSPVEFAFPGEPGFFTTEPRFDCDALMSRLPIPLIKEHPAHDHL